VALDRLSRRAEAPGRAPARAVLLDALGTLVGIEPPWAPLTRLLAERHGLAVDVGAVRRALGAEMTYYRANCQSAGDAAGLARLRDGCAGVIAAELGPPAAAIDRSGLTETLLDALRFAAYPEVAAALGRLRAGGARLVVVSNWDISLHEALEQAGIGRLVDGAVSSAEIGAAKPAAAIFRAGLALAGVPAERAIHVGDSYEEDVQGARAAGIEPVLLERTDAGGLLAPGGGGAGVAGEDRAVRRISSLAGLVDP
jgi:putative hydrolase of the HAD superfamily